MGNRQTNSPPEPSASKQSDSRSSIQSTNILKSKSTNILIYSEDFTAAEKFGLTLRNVLDCGRYTVYCISEEALKTGAWKGQVVLLALVGNVGETSSLFVEHFLKGGRLFTVNSDLLYDLVLNLKTEEEENNLENLTEHILCKSDKDGKIHELKIKVFPSDVNPNTPSIIQVTDLSNNGVAVFSTIDLEEDSTDMGDGSKKISDIICKITADILSFHLKTPEDSSKIEFTKGYFLGDQEKKLLLIESLPSNDKHMQKLEDLTIQWCYEDEPTQSPSKSFLPVYLNKEPDLFSTKEYFEHLTSKNLGRLLIYSDVLNSTMDITKESLIHGIAVVSARQLQGRGRGENAWITPKGQAAMSVQVWQKMSSSLPLIQHAAALAIVVAIRTGIYENLDVRIKWPNDIYYGRNVKIGGVVTTASCMGDDVIINIGTGVNISNTVPTVCVNEIIEEYNKNTNQGKVLPVSIEKFLARYCSELETILDILNQEGGIKEFLKYYYKYWLHSKEEIRVKTQDDGNIVQGIITGIDDAGWLIVRTPEGEVTVAPDGNTFDMMNGLIAPKI